MQITKKMIKEQRLKVKEALTNCDVEYSHIENELRYFKGSDFDKHYLEFKLADERRRFHYLQGRLSILTELVSY